jgi:hypothetical protein
VAKVTVTKKVKTLFLWNTFDDATCFFELKGDYREFHKVFLNGDTDDKVLDKLNALV